MVEPGAQGQPDEATLDLLVKQVTEGLSPAEQRTLDALDSAITMEQLSELERSAAAISLATPASALPTALRARLERQAEEFIAASGDALRLPSTAGHASAGAHIAPGVTRAVTAANAPPVAGRSPSTDAGNGARLAPRPAGRSREWGWFAAAACLVLALVGWFRTPLTDSPPAVAVAPVQLPPAVPTAPSVPTPPPVPTPPSLAELRQALLAKADAIKLTLAATKDPAAAGVVGDAVWDPVTQQGFLHFTGLAHNDPKVHEYQIWIFDAARDQRYPVAGGVFDVPADVGEVIIPIRAALIVHKPAAFAVTLEQPGGVVVSSRDRVIVLGATG